MRGLLPLLSSSTTTTTTTTKLFASSRPLALARATTAPSASAAASARLSSTVSRARTAAAASTYRSSSFAAAAAATGPARAAAAAASAFGPAPLSNNTNRRRAMASSAAAASSDAAASTVDWASLGLTPNPGEDVIVLGGGCFWCIEAAFNNMKGVSSAISGYAAGNVDRPTYKEVCGGDTGHNEVVAVYYDPKVVDLETILGVFFALHDPTTLNRQGNDVGTQYRSGIYYVGEAQRATAEKVMREVAEAKIWGNAPLTTELVALKSGPPRFHAAESYHQGYFLTSPENPYCQFVVAPKVSKFRSKFAHLLK